MEPAPDRLQGLRRAAWLPVLTPGDGAPADSKLAGTPWLAADEEWPRCGGCGAPMEFVVQIALAATPAPLRARFGEGLLQVFYCTATTPRHCEVADESYRPFTRAQLARRVDPGTTPGRAQVARPESLGAFERHGVRHVFEPRRITGWDPIGDYPSLAELGAMGVSLGEGGAAAHAAVAHDGDKLGGWGAWLFHDPAEPCCPRCRAPLREPLLQLRSGGACPYVWGDLGTAWLTTCANHPDVVAFFWECL